MVSERDIEKGVWIVMQHGFDYHAFCVLKVCGNRVLMGMPSWCVESAQWFKLHDINKNDGFIIGKGIYRWWRHILPWPNDLIFPYSRPVEGS